MNPMKYYHLPGSILFMIQIFMIHINTTQACIQEEKTGLIGLKNLLESNGADSSKHLSDWLESSKKDCCEWERVTCDPVPMHVTELFLWNLKDIQSINEEDGMINSVWSINCSLFLPFPDLKSLNLSFNSFARWEKNYGFEKLSALKKLEIIDLSSNNFDDNSIYQPLGAITSLKTLLLGNNALGDSFPANELVGLDNLETLDLTYCGYVDWLPKQGFEKLLVFKKLETLNLVSNALTVEVLPYLNSITSLKVLNLRGNGFGGSFLAQDLSNLTKLESLDLGDNRLSGVEGFESLGKFKNLTSLDVSNNMFNRTIFKSLSPLSSLKNLNIASNNLGDPFPTRELIVFESLEMLDLSSNGISSLTMKDFKLLSKLNKLRHLDLSSNGFDKKGVLQILDAIPSLRFLSLKNNFLEGPISNQDLTFNHSRLEVLLLSGNFLNGSLPMEGLTSLRFLEVLDLKGNSFIGRISPLIGELSSLKVLSLASNQLNGSLPDHGLCDLKKLEELDLSNNLLQGNLPSCLSNLKSLRLFVIAQNYFTGNINSSLISKVTSLEYIDLSHNLFEGTFSFSSLSNHSKLVVFQIISNNNKLEVETEDIDWFPMFQLKVLSLSNCNLNKLSGKKIPKFLTYQNKLRSVDLSDNNLDDMFPNWLLVNNTGLDVFKVRKNSLSGTFHLLSVHTTTTLDFSDNHLNGKLQSNIGDLLPFISYLNLSKNAFEGGIPSSFGVTRQLSTVDLSSNNFLGEVPMQSFGNCSMLGSLLLSNNSLHGGIFTGSFSLTSVRILQLANNQFTGPLETSVLGSELMYIDVSNNNLSGEFSGLRNSTISTTWATVILRNNSFLGEFPCSLVPTEFMDVSFNAFSGSISCSNQNLGIVKHLHLQGNNFTGLIPHTFLNSSVLLTLDISNNLFSGTFPIFLTPLSDLRILLSRGNLLNGSLPSHVCWLNKISLMDLSNNFFTGSIPRCLNNITFGLIAGYGFAFVEYPIRTAFDLALYNYEGILTYQFENHGKSITYSKKEEVNFVTKSSSHLYQGNILNYMSGLDLSGNSLTGEIPKELGDLTAVRALNVSHNQLTGPIPKSFSNLKQVESLDLSYNVLSGNIPIELTSLNSLAVFSVAHNNLSGTIPYGKNQFSTFDASSYEGNPGLCGQPSKKSCNIVDTPIDLSDESDGDWVIFFAIVGGAYITFLIGTLTVLFINPNWRKWSFDLIDRGLESCHSCLSR